MLRLFVIPKYLRIILISMFLMACSSGKVVKTYEGEVLANEQLAILTAPENITVLSVNGKEVATYLLSNIETKYGLKSGPNQVVFKYESVWANPGAKTNSGGRSVKTESGPLLLNFVAEKGEVYNFAYSQPGNLREARQVASDFEAEIVNGAGETVTKSIEFSEKTDSLQVSGASQAQTEVADSELSAGVVVETGVLSRLNSMKELWEAASPEERKAFLAWAFRE